MESKLEILEEPNWSKRQLDEIREYIFEIKSKIREKKSSGFNNEPFVIDIKPKREETFETLQLFTQFEIGVIHPDNNIHLDIDRIHPENNIHWKINTIYPDNNIQWNINVDGENFCLKDFAFEGKNIYLIFKKGE